MRYNHLDMLPEKAFQPIGKRMTLEGGGKGGGSAPAPSSQTVTNTSIPEYARPYVETMLGKTEALTDINQNPYQTYGGQRIAEFSPLQQKAFSNVGNMQTAPQLGQASNATAGVMAAAANNQYNPMQTSYLNASAPSLNQYSMQGPQNLFAPMARSAQLGNAPLAQSAGFQGPQNVYSQDVNAPSLQNYQMQGPQDVSGTGYNASQMQGAQTNYNPNLAAYQMGPASQVSAQDFTSPGTANQYMNPYLNSALQPQLAEIGRQYDITGQQEKSQATGQGAFGGNRQALMQSENQRNKNTAMNTAIGKGYNTAFNNAQQQFNAQQQANLQAQQANQQANLTTGQQNLASQLGVQQLGTQTGLQAQLANLSNEQQASVNNQAAQNQAAGMNAQQALQAALANQQTGLSTGQQNLQANLGVQQLGSGQNLQAQQLNQASGLQAGLANQQTGYNTALQNAQMNQQSNLANQGILSQYGLQQGQLNQQTGLANQQARLQAGLANQQAGLTTGTQNLQAALQTQGLGSGQNLQAQLANQGAFGNAQQLAANQQQFGANIGQQNLQQILAGAGQLGQLGQTQFGQQQGINTAQQQVGAVQQAQAQQNLDQGYQDFLKQQNYPYQQLAFMSDMTRGLPLSQSAATQYTAPPSMVSQLGGLGMAGLGAYGAAGGFKQPYKEGGIISAYKDGGKVGYSVGGDISTMTDRQLTELLSNPQLNPMEMKAVEDLLALHRRMEINPQTPQIMAQNQGIDAIPTGDMVPVEAAGGGIIAFAEGKKVKASNAEDMDTEIADLKNIIKTQNAEMWSSSPTAKSDALQAQYAKQALADKEAEPWNFVRDLGLGAAAGTSQYALSNIGAGGTYANTEAGKRGATADANSKLALIQQIESEKSQEARKASMLNANQSSLTQLYNNRNTRDSIQATREATAQSRLDMIDSRNQIAAASNFRSAFDDTYKKLSDINNDPMKTMPENKLPDEQIVAKAKVLAFAILPKNHQQYYSQYVQQAPAQKVVSSQDQQAIAWANANPKDPRAAIIKQKLGV
jgi:hypothetical protein